MGGKKRTQREKGNRRERGWEGGRESKDKKEGGKERESKSRRERGAESGKEETESESDRKKEEGVGGEGARRSE